MCGVCKAKSFKLAIPRITFIIAMDAGVPFILTNHQEWENWTKLSIEVITHGTGSVLRGTVMRKHARDCCPYENARMGSN